MAKKKSKSSEEYWREREAEQLKHYIKDEKEYQKRIDEIYDYMMDQIQKEINGFYSKYARKEGITLAEAKRRVSKLDIDAYARKAKRYVKDKDFSKEANEEMRLYNATMKINRLEMLKANIGLELVSGFDELQKYFGGALTERTLKEFERQAGILGKTVQNNAKAADAIVNSSFHNAKFSDRIWMHQDLLKSELDKLLRQGMIQGKSSTELARLLRQKFNVSKSNAERLMVTELRRAQTEASKKAYEENGVKKYEFLTANPGGACDICTKLNGKIFEVKDMMPGKNAPPIHPRCHCTTVEYQDYSELDALLDFIDKGGTAEEWNMLKNKEHFDTIRLTDEEKRALMDYKSFESYRINDILRKSGNVKELSEKERKFVKQLDSALSKMPKYEGDLIRTVDFSDWTNQQRRLDDYVKGFNPDETITIDQYWSTSKGMGYNKKANVKIYIQNAKNGRDISSVGLDEKEVLYERKSQFVVISKVFRDGIWNILLEEK